MAKLDVLAGTTSKLQALYIRTLATGAALTGLTNASSGLIAYYKREGESAATAITLGAGTVGTWSSGGFKEVDAAHMPGLYELGIPNAVIAAGAKSAVIELGGVSGMENCPLEIQLTTYDPYAALGDLGLLAVLVADDVTDSTKLSHLLTLLRAWVDNTATIINGGGVAVERLKARDGTTNAGRTLTYTGTVPSDTTRTAS